MVTTFGHGPLRTTVECVVALLLAVLLFRTFVAEGFMISTGSMAPTLLGFHKRVACPKCGELFAYGTAWDESANHLAASSSEFEVEQSICPNCSQQGIDLSHVPRNHGDQLLVNKQAYLWSSPQRWEIAVFRNPNLPTEAYVKRIVGLPGEAVSIRNGDLWINGEIARKPLAVQRTMWIPVYHQEHRSTHDTSFQDRWVSTDGWLEPTSNLRGWRSSPTTFLFREQTEGGASEALPAKSSDSEQNTRSQPAGQTAVAAESSISWIEYQHWVRSGGTHITTVTLEEWPSDLQLATLPPSGLKYDSKTKKLSSFGVLPDDVVSFLKTNSQNLVFLQAIDKLKAASHLAPITDRYGYNPATNSMEPNSVRDIAFVGELSLPQDQGRFFIQLTDGLERYTLDFDSQRESVRLFLEGTDRPLRVGPWSPPERGKSVRIEASMIDRQVALAIDGHEVFPAWPISAVPPGAESPRSPVRFGALGGTVRISNPTLFRDVFYTFQRSRHAVNRPYPLGPEEYFVLGDNSPVSHDSRQWEKPGVHRKLLVGKPFLVHLPSQPGRLKIGDQEWLLRLPDFDRVRFLR